MGSSCTLNAIAPARVWRGAQAWQQAQGAIQALCAQPLVLGRSAATAPVRAKLLADLAAQGLQPLAAELRFDCCEMDLEALAPRTSQAACDGVIAIGGGKVLVWHTVQGAWSGDQAAALYTDVVRPALETQYPQKRKFCILEDTVPTGNQSNSLR